MEVKARVGGREANAAATINGDGTEATAMWTTLPIGTGLKVELIYILQSNPEVSFTASSVNYDSTSTEIALSGVTTS